mmetsp:Transcript_64969/g.76287  ORF Transcript_64969/g.76287 Transcript_64969/m.76287 type:complete len:83 (+) Transcript_64969:450-698(+)
MSFPHTIYIRTSILKFLERASLLKRLPVIFHNEAFDVWRFGRICTKNIFHQFLSFFFVQLGYIWSHDSANLNFPSLRYVPDS